MNAPTDEELLAKYVSGDTASFELLVRRHARELYQFAYRFTGHSVAAEDVVQETLLQLHSSAAKFDPRRRLKPWLFTIAANKARDQLRRRSRKRELPLDAYVDGHGETNRRFLHLFSSDSEPTDWNLDIDEKRRLVRDVVDTLPDKLREVLVLAYYHHFPYREIAEILDIPLGTVKSRLHAAVGQFHSQYEEATQQDARRESES